MRAKKLRRLGIDGESVKLAKSSGLRREYRSGTALGQGDGMDPANMS